MIKPEGSTITVDGNVLFVADIKYSFVVDYFDRIEFQHERLRSAPNNVGQHAIRTTLLGNTPAQIVIGAVSFQDIVPLSPDVVPSGSNYGNIKKKFNIKRWEIAGAVSLAANVDAVAAIAENHAQQLAKFQAHLDKGANMETSYASLIALQSETFSYLTTTAVLLTGDAIGFQPNTLITNFNPSVEYSYISDEFGNVSVLKSFSLTIEQRTITAKDVVV